MTRMFNALAAALFALVCSACAHAHFDTPHEFAELEEHGDYRQRATSAHGVVMAVRELDAPRDTSLSFWSEAITQRMTGGSGYALLSTRDLRAKSGEKGQLLAFGHDQNGQTFDYWVAIFPLKKRVVLVELGGRRERFAAAEPELTRALASLTLP